MSWFIGSPTRGRNETQVEVLGMGRGEKKSGRERDRASRLAVYCGERQHPLGVTDKSCVAVVGHFVVHDCSGVNRSLQSASQVQHKSNVAKWCWRRGVERAG